VLTGLAGDDTLKGFGGADILNGGPGIDTLVGGAGADQMTGLGGSDTYYVDNAGDSVTESGGQGSDTVRTSVSWTLTAGADVETLQTTNAAGVGSINLTGNSSGNVITGNNGNNILNGGDGNDTLTGLGGQDWFLFDTTLNAATNVDRIEDFTPVDDTIWLDHFYFPVGLPALNISASDFVIGATAQDAGDRIIYNDVTGAVYYDSDGTGGTAAIQFATLDPGLALTNLDFYVA
jgi:Ca2+-binding RTX toxin-like protein